MKVLNSLQAFLTSSIRRQLMLGIMLVHAVLMSLFVYDMVERQRDFLREQSTIHAYSLAEMLGVSSISWVLANDIVGLEEVLGSHNNYPDLDYAMVLDTKGRVLGHTKRDKVGLYLSDAISLEMLQADKKNYLLVNSSQLIDVASPIFSNGEFIGWARVGLGQDEILAGLGVIARNGILYTLFAIGIGALFAFFMAKGLTNGLRHLIHVADGIKQGKIDLRSNLSRADELGQLGEDFNLMLDVIHQGKDELKETLEILREREQNLSVTLNSIADGVIVTDRGARVIRMNPVAERLTGWFLKDADGRIIEDIFSIHQGLAGAPMDNPIRDALNSEKVADQHQETTLTAKEGRKYQISISSAPVRDGDGSILGAVLVFRDVTKEYQMHQLLMDNEKRYRTIFESNQVIKLIVDFANGTIVECNQAAVRFYGYDATTLISMQIADINTIPAERAQKLLKQIRNGEKTHISTRHRLKSGEMRDVSIYPCPITTSSGRKLDYAMIFDVTERIRAEKVLRQYELIVSSTADMLAMLDNNYTYLTANDAYLETFDHRASQVIGGTVADLYGKEVFSKILKPKMDLCLQGKKINFQQWFELTARGSKQYMDVSYTPYLDGDEQVQGLIVTIRDITEQKLVEEKLRQSLKMDTVGQLTGGIAHDFNNLLGISLGNLEMIKMSSKVDEKTQKRLDSIQKANRRAAKLTQQLLGFSRRKIDSIEHVDINQEINKMDSLIARSLTPQVVVEHQLDKDLWLTRIDSGDFQDALLNLTLNAKDAMNGHGLLTIKTRNIRVDAAYCLHHPGLAPGDFIELSFSDNGSGIESELQKRIFEPFFTTKEASRGTGLGLAMVFGFIERSKGHIFVESESGIGTTFTILLPREEAQEKTAVSSDQPEYCPELHKGNETLLVVDDEPGLRTLARDSLEDLGYKVHTAEDADHALVILAEEPAVKLMLSDVVMPGKMNGYELAETASQKYPQLKILLTSGYSKNTPRTKAQSRFDANLLSKPYSLDKLAKVLREMLEDRG